MSWRQCAHFGSLPWGATTGVAMLPGEGGHAWRCAHMKLTSALPWKPAECFRVLSSKAADDIFGVFGNGGCVGGDALIIKYAAVSAKKSPSKPQSASVHVEK